MSRDVHLPGVNVTLPFSLPLPRGSGRGTKTFQHPPRLGPRSVCRSVFQRGTKPVSTNVPSKQVCWPSGRDPARPPLFAVAGAGGARWRGRRRTSLPPTFLSHVDQAAFYAYARTPLGPRGVGCSRSGRVDGWIDGGMNGRPRVGLSFKSPCIILGSSGQGGWKERIAFGYASTDMEMDTPGEIKHPIVFSGNVRMKAISSY